MSTTDLEIIDLTSIVGDMELACDYNDEKNPHDEPAEWVLRTVRCTCGAGVVRLACDPCKTRRLETLDAVYCTFCNAVYQPARTAYAYVERLEKR